MDASTAAAIWMVKVSTMTVMFGSDVGIGTPGSCFQCIVRDLGEMGNQIAGHTLAALSGWIALKR
jgi:hypothetical protein